MLGGVFAAMLLAVGTSATALAHPEQATEGGVQTAWDTVEAAAPVGSHISGQGLAHISANGVAAIVNHNPLCPPHFNAEHP